MDRPRALMMSPEAPFPAIGGGPLRTASVLTWLGRGFATDLILFAADQTPDPRAALPPGMIDQALLLRLPAHSKRWLPRMARNALRLGRGVPPLIDRFAGFDRRITDWLQGRHYDVAVLEHFWSAPYARPLGSYARVLWLDLHNVESTWHDRVATGDPWPVSWGHRRFAAAYRQLEQELLPAFHRVLVPSEADAGRLSGRAVVVPNAIPALPCPPRSDDPVVIFSGNLEYHPNRQAMMWFHTAVFPLLKATHPSLTWRILGRSPDAVSRDIARDPQVEILGPVEDAVTELARAQVAIVPVVSGSGTRMKIVEAWAAGTAVVSTSVGAEGLDAVDGLHILVADSPRRFAEATSRLLDSPHDRTRLGLAGRALYESRYTWPAAWSRLDALWAGQAAEGKGMA